MKKGLIIYLLFLHAFVFLVLFKSDFIPRVDRYLGLGAIKKGESDQYYNQLVTFQSRQDVNMPDGMVIMIGDSLVQGFNPALLSYSTANYGIGRDTTEGVLNRIPSYASLSNAKAIVLAVGINDLKVRSNEKTIENYQAILKSLPGHVPVIICGIMPVAESYPYSYLKPRILRLNTELEDLSRGFQNVYYVTPAFALTDQFGWLAKDYDAGDGVHLNGAGNLIWAKELNEALKRVLSLSE